MGCEFKRVVIGIKKNFEKVVLGIKWKKKYIHQNIIFPLLIV